MRFLLLIKADNRALQAEAISLISLRERALRNAEPLWYYIISPRKNQEFNIKNMIEILFSNSDDVR